MDRQYAPEPQPMQGHKSDLEHCVKHWGNYPQMAPVVFTVPLAPLRKVQGIRELRNANCRYDMQAGYTAANVRFRAA
ncbi:MAG: hypothetical protein ACRCYS_07300 [Beijerinckiaceae bacterium]